MGNFDGISCFASYENTVFYTQPKAALALQFPSCYSSILINKVSQEFYIFHACRVAVFYGFCRKNIFTFKILPAAQ